MIEIGIEMPFQRNTIRLGLFKLFNAKWSKNSVNVPRNLKSYVSSLDLIYTLGDLLRQVVVMKSQLEYYRELNFRLDPSNAERFLTLEHFLNFEGNIKNLKSILERMKPITRPQLIQKLPEKKFSKKAVISCAALSVIALIYFLKK